MTNQNTAVLSIIAEALDHCSDLIADAQLDLPQVRVADHHEHPNNLLEQCEALTRQVSSDAEPIRTIHHFACTGGTLISKCLASMPNVQLLSEVNAYSDIPSDSNTTFHPTDLVRLLRNSSRGGNADLELEVFLSGIEVILRDCLSHGQRLILRDHTHSSYCVGEEVSKHLNLRQSLQSRFSIRSALTVRHPLDSYLSLIKQRWLHFEPADIDEYSSRYHSFLDDYSDVKIFKYESFVERPDTEMRAICAELKMPFLEGFEGLFGVHKLSGDSGRSSQVITPRQGREVGDDLKSQIEASLAYVELCERLDYPLIQDA